MLTRTEKIVICVIVGLSVLGGIVAALVVSFPRKKRFSFSLSSSRMSIRMSILDKLKITTNTDIQVDDITFKNIVPSSTKTITPREFELGYSLPGKSKILIKGLEETVEVVPTPTADAIVHHFRSNQSIVEFESTFTTAVAGTLTKEDIEITEGLVSLVTRVNEKTFKLVCEGLPEEGLFSVALKEKSQLRDQEFGYPLSGMLLGKIQITPELLKKITQSATQVDIYMRLEFEIEFSLDIFTEPKVSDLEFFVDGTRVTDQGMNKIVRNNRFLQLILNPQSPGDLKIVILAGSIILSNGPYPENIDLSVKVIRG